jgi:hypothetical protein
MVLAATVVPRHFATQISPKAPCELIPSRVQQTPHDQLNNNCYDTDGSLSNLVIMPNDA